jgi:enamine deaminase RidA (YjgF/YER057c/UK114 family)
MRDVILPDADRRVYEQFHFAPAVRAGNLILCSGQLGTDAKGTIPDDPAEEFRLAWQAVGRILEHAGSSYEKILESTTFHVGLQEHLGTFMSIRDEFVSAPWPAWTAIGVSELAVPGARVEVRVVAEG